MKFNIFWFRRDLRLTDNTGLYHALSEKIPTLALFIFDKNILDVLEDKADPRITFIFDEVIRLKNRLEKMGSSLLIKIGKPENIFEELIQNHSIHSVFTNHDYEPYARKRDDRIGKLLQHKGILFKTFKDQVIFEKDEIVKDDGKPYTVFTPYSRKWKSLFTAKDIKSYPSEIPGDLFFKTAPLPTIELADTGFERSKRFFPPREINTRIIENYHQTRDYPALNGTSRLGLHLRFGTISIRNLVSIAARISPVFLNELIWREFYMMILWHFPQVETDSFKPQYDFIEWRNNEEEFEAWCLGKTGYPIVDAGMRELEQTGYMHNRLRMITASFLTKHLLIDWRWGERWFAQKLLDYELASNNGGWQWAAGTGCDAAPYFRVFNPDLQTEKFDREKEYILKWVPESKSGPYLKRIVDHSEARINAISAYKKALGKNF